MNEPKPVGEFELIDWIRLRTQAQSRGRERTLLGIGDDCALLRFSPGAETLVTVDMLMEGRHFVLERDGPEAVGYKALGVNLSDIAAMAGLPVAAVISVALPRAEGAAIAKGLYAGMVPLAGRFEVDFVGGDTNAWDGPLVISVTMIGETTARGAVRRTGARPGDVIFVTGPLGGSLNGRHLRPEPRIAEALALNAAVPIHAMIDISDGLGSDLGHILEESGKLGAIIDIDAIPIHGDARTSSALDGRPPLDHALDDGEDFELCLVVAPATADRLSGSTPPPAVLHRIGVVTESPGFWLRSTDGGLIARAPRGFDHLRIPNGD